MIDKVCVREPEDRRHRIPISLFSKELARKTSQRLFPPPHHLLCRARGKRIQNQPNDSGPWLTPQIPVGRPASYIQFKQEHRPWCWDGGPGPRLPPRSRRVTPARLHQRRRRPTWDRSPTTRGGVRSTARPGEEGPRDRRPRWGQRRTSATGTD